MPSEIVEMRNPGAGVLNDAGTTGSSSQVRGWWRMREEKSRNCNKHLFGSLIEFGEESRLVAPF